MTLGSEPPSSGSSHLGDHVNRWGSLIDMLTPKLLPQSVRRGMFQVGPRIQFWEQVSHRRDAVVPGPHAKTCGVILRSLIIHRPWARPAGPGMQKETAKKDVLPAGLLVRCRRVVPGNGQRTVSLVARTDSNTTSLCALGPEVSSLWVSYFFISSRRLG